MDDNYENEERLIRAQKDRIRIFLIIYFFSKKILDASEVNYVKVLEGELRIQKLDFLLRNPDYLAYQLLLLSNSGEIRKEEVKNIIKEIFKNDEPVIKRLEMEKFFFGAYENIDDVIAFLDSFGFIKFKSERDTKLNKINKKYYITKLAQEKMENEIKEIPSLDWYLKRCELIRKYFGNFSGSELKNQQYEIEEYKETTYKEYIKSIQNKVKEMYYEEFKEEL